MVATFRSDELHRRHPLTAWLAETERQPRVERIDVERFERDELVELLTGIAGCATGHGPRRLDRPAVRRERVLRRGARRGRRGSRDGSRERLPETLRGVLAGPPVGRIGGRRQAGRSRRGGRPAGRTRAPCRGLRDVRPRPRPGAPQRDRRSTPVRRSGRVRRTLPIPACAGRGGRLRRAPPVRAPGAARRIRARHRAATGGGGGRRRHTARRDRPSLAGGAGPGPRSQCRDRRRRRLARGVRLRRCRPAVRACDRAVGPRSRHRPTDRPRPRGPVRRGERHCDPGRRRVARRRPRPDARSN